MKKILKNLTSVHYARKINIFLIDIKRTMAGLQG